MDGCLACDLAEGRRELPGGRVAETAHWLVEHCVGPLGLGAMVVKPRRHVLHVWELTAEESAELGPLLARTAAVARALVDPAQVYVCLWSHAGWEPVHLHFVVQPVAGALRERHAKPGPFLQADMFRDGHPPDATAVAALCERARAMWPRVDLRPGATDD